MCLVSWIQVWTGGWVQLGRQSNYCTPEHVSVCFQLVAACRCSLSISSTKFTKPIFGTVCIGNILVGEHLALPFRYCTRLHTRQLSPLEWWCVLVGEGFQFGSLHLRQLVALHRRCLYVCYKYFVNSRRNVILQSGLPGEKWSSKVGCDQHCLRLRFHAKLSHPCILNGFLTDQPENLRAMFWITDVL